MSKRKVGKHREAANIYIKANSFLVLSSRVYSHICLHHCAHRDNPVIDWLLLLREKVLL